MESRLPIAGPGRGRRKGKAEREGQETCCFLIKLGKETGAERDSVACSLAFITPLPPDLGAVLDGRARLLKMALLIRHSWGKWLLMKGLKRRMDNSSPAANALGSCSLCMFWELSSQVLLMLDSGAELHGLHWHPSHGAAPSSSSPSPRLQIRRWKYALSRISSFII